MRSFCLHPKVFLNMMYCDECENPHVCDLDKNDRFDSASWHYPLRSSDTNCGNRHKGNCNPQSLIRTFTRRSLSCFIFGTCLTCHTQILHVRCLVIMPSGCGNRSDLHDDAFPSWTDIMIVPSRPNPGLTAYASQNDPKKPWHLAGNWDFGESWLLVINNTLRWYALPVIFKVFECSISAFSPLEVTLFGPGALTLNEFPKSW
jgi:hypothetical protein